MKNSVKNYQENLNKVGTEVNDLEYIDHIVKENGKQYFVIIHLNGNKRFEEIL